MKTVNRAQPGRFALAATARENLKKSVIFQIIVENVTKKVFFLIFFYRGYRVLKNSFFNVSKPRRHRGLIFLRFFSIFPQSGMRTLTFDDFHYRHEAPFF